MARPWQIEDLLLAMGDPAVTALIDSRGKLSDAQVGEKLRAEIERNRSGGMQHWACSISAMASSSAAAGFGQALYARWANFEVGFHVVKRCWGKGFATEAALAALGYASSIAACPSC